MLARLAGALGLGLLLLMISACREPSAPGPGAPLFSPPTSLPSPDNSDTPNPPSGTALPAIGESPTAIPDTIALTIWTPEEFSPFAPVGGDVLANQIAEFEREHPNIRVVYKLKAPHGKGGLVDFVLQVNDLVSQQLPDVVVVESRELAPLARAGLLQPLTRDFAAGVFLDLFAPAQAVASLDRGYSNLPVVIEAEHLVYDTSRLSEPPATWDQVIQSRTSFAFAADSVDEFLFYYLENGGVLPTNYGDGLSLGVLETVLTYYASLRRELLLPDAALSAKSPGDAMLMYVNGQVAMAQVDAHEFIEKRAILANTGFAAVPTHDGRTTTPVTVWSYAVLTNDPVRHLAAVQFIEWMNDPTRIAEWARITREIPARKTAYAAFMQPQAYAEFLWDCLENGIVAPSLIDQQPYAGAIQSAVRAVLRGQLSPQVAAAQTGLVP